MGTPLPFNPAGEPCTFCWGVDFPFGAGQTPQIITATFTDWRPGFLFDESMRSELESPKQLYQLTSPCRYAAISATWSWLLIFRAGDSIIQIVNLDIPANAFRSEPAPPCTKIHTNDFTNPDLVIAIFGIVTLTWSEIFSE